MASWQRSTKGHTANQEIEIRSSMTRQMLLAALFACSLLLSTYASSPARYTHIGQSPLKPVAIAPRTVVINGTRPVRDIHNLNTLSI